jgi:hypothetical protein
MKTEMKSIKTLADFYKSMRLLHEIRVKIVSKITNSEILNMKDLKSLEQIKDQLLAIPKKKDLFKLKTIQGQSILLELDYELGELERDNVFLKHGYKALKQYMCKIHNNYLEDVNRGLDFLKRHQYKHFVTDRDGTISNYCGRYQSSVQPIYNALCLSEFAKTIEGQSIILTSAPLLDMGLADISVQPENEYILAGSKGREILINGKKQVYPIAETEQQKLDELNYAIDSLLKNEEYATFKYIGSGLQHKFGQTTLARQDKNNSILDEKSLALKKKIESLLNDLDPNEQFFSLEDTGKDLEIMLKIKSDKDNLEEFDKGHGLKFIMNHLDENIQNQRVLICGDTASDVHLITAAQDLGAIVTTVFVTEDETLKNSVKSICKDSFFVSSPDVLIYMFFKYSKHNQSWKNPLSLFLSLIN